MAVPQFGLNTNVRENPRATQTSRRACRAIGS